MPDAASDARSPSAWRVAATTWWRPTSTAPARKPPPSSPAASRSSSTFATPRRTARLREHDDEPAAAINWSGPRLLTADEVAEHAVALLDSKRLVRVVPPWRGLGARAMAMAGRPGLRIAPLLRKRGARHRIAFKDR